MRWAKTGLLISPPTHLAWAASHAAVPHAETDADGRVRVYFTTRDSHRRSHVALADVWLGEAEPRVDVFREPLLTPGVRGAFDDSGVMTSCLVRHEGRDFLYYQGWSLGVTVPFYVFVGCATRTRPDEPFVRVSSSPVLGRDVHDPFMCSSPWVLVEGGRWRMWYVSNRGWRANDAGELHYVVHVRYAESADGITWERDGTVCIDFASETESVISRPCVVRDGALYRMWYSYRGEGYRIGYAESADGVSWVRKDSDAGIDVSESGWDSEMVEYAVVFDHDGRRHMLYNGNGFGATGIGHAVLEDGA
jgi:hypothetical protein